MSAGLQKGLLLNLWQLLPILRVLEIPSFCLKQSPGGLKWSPKEETGLVDFASWGIT